MRRILRAKLLASVLVVGVVPFVAAAVPAQAQEQSNVSFDSFYDQLAPYGDWVYSDRWGLVWQPEGVADDFRPYYSGGYWAYTDAYGWTWTSDYDWGDITFHYGRWVDDPDDGWMWIPGYSWSPGWVIWRSNPQSIGWMPMPPDDDFLLGRGDAFIGISFAGVSVDWNDTSSDYGYSRWYGKGYDQRRFAANWTFVDTGHLADHDYRHVAYKPDRAFVSIRQTINITHYTVINNYVVNRSVDVHAVERASGHRITAVATASVFKHPNMVMTVAADQKIRAREFVRAPHGTGVANSAPPPPPAVISKLSDHVATHHAGGAAGVAGKHGASSHLFTKTTITAPAATSQFHGKPNPATPANAPLPPPGSHPAPTATSPVVTKTVPGTTTGQSSGEMSGSGKMHEQHARGPDTSTAPTGGSTAGPVHPFEHRAEPPMTAPPVAVPVVKPVEHRVEQPVTVIHNPPPAPPVTVTHNPPPVVEAPKPPATSEPKKDEHKTKPDHNPPN